MSFWRACSLLLLLSLPAMAQVAVTGNVQYPNASGGPITVKFQLVNCGNSTPAVPGIATLVNSATVLNTSPTGAILGPDGVAGDAVLYGNDQISCNGGQTSRYAVTYLVNGSATGNVAYYYVPYSVAGHAAGTVAFNLNSATPIEIVPPLTPPYPNYTQCPDGYVANGFNKDFSVICEANADAYTPPNVVKNNPTNSQTITQPAGTSFIVNNVLLAGSLTGTASNASTLSSGTPGALSVPWGWSPKWTYGGNPFDSYASLSGSPSSFQSQAQLQTKYNLASDIPIDCAGCPGGSVPSFYSEVETSGGSNIQAHAIAGYVVNGGSQDAVGVSGRVYRKAGATSTTSGLAEASGFYGSGFNYDTLPGATFGGELVIFNQVTGTTAKDRWSLTETNGGTGAFHLSSLSSGSPSDAYILMDSDTILGKGVWNGILMDANSFYGYKTHGTVGFNGGNWSLANNAPETGFKLGDTLQDVWKVGSQPFVINSSIGQVQLYGNGNNSAAPTTNAGLQIFAGAGAIAYLDFYAGGVHGGNLGYVGGSGYFDVNSLGTTDTHINRLGGLVYAPTPTSTAAVAGQHQVATVDYVASATSYAGGAPSQSSYTYLPNGYIEQWTVGTSPVNGRGELTVALPFTFPHACLNATITAEYTSTVVTTNYQGIGFYLEPNGCGTNSVYMQYDVRGDGTATSSYVPRIHAIGW